MWTGDFGCVPTESMSCISNDSAGGSAEVVSSTAFSSVVETSE